MDTDREILKVNIQSFSSFSLLFSVVYNMVTGVQREPTKSSQLCGFHNDRVTNPAL